MKYLKITIVAIAIIGVGMLSFKLYSEKTEELTQVKLTDNTFIDNIKQQIDAIKNSPEDTFCRDKYKETVYLINQYKKGNKITQQESDNLRKETEYAYHNKFIEEANYVFSQASWSSDDMGFIKTELLFLGASTYITNKESLHPLNQILVEYKEIKSFLAKIKTYSAYNPTPKPSDLFDSYAVETYIKKALKMSKTPSKIKNNWNLMNGLKNVKSLMLSKHLNFLKKKLSIINSVDCTKYDDYLQIYNKFALPIYNDINKFEDTANARYGCETSKWYNTTTSISNSVFKVIQGYKVNCFTPEPEE